MTPNDLNPDLPPQTESTSAAARALLVAFCLAAGLGYRIVVGLLPPSILQLAVLAALAIVLLLLAVLARRQSKLTAYWEIPLAFFIFTVAGIFGDSNSFGSVQTAFVVHVLHETPSANNPIASSLLGTVLGQLVGTVGLTLPIVLLTRAAGGDLKSIFIAKSRKPWALVVAIIAFVLIFLFVASGRTARFFPNNGVTPARVLALAPAIIVLVLCNGLREELFFRGLFLKKYGKFLGPLSSNLLSVFIFASFHVQVTYSSSLPIFLLVTLVLGLWLGYLMQKSGSLLASVIFHAATDIPIFVVYLSYLSA
jgi:membrane protease YdiL (CAAX protease family)